MSLLSWAHPSTRVAGRQSNRRANRVVNRLPQGRRLFLEGLEDRRLLAQVASLELNPHEYDPSSILVRFRSDAAEVRGAGILHGAALGRQFGAVPGLRSVHLPKGQDVEAALSAFRASPDVLYAEPNYRVQAALTPNDELYPSLYGMENIDAPAAWETTTGSSDIVVAVIDTGVDYNHPDLAPNMWVNGAEKNGVPGSDDDGNGFVDDIYGYDFINNDGNPIDDNFHGTHVAGTIGAVGNNGLGVAGVNWGVKIMALKFLDSGGGGWTDDAVEAVNYATMMRQNGVDIRLTSNSWGGGGYSQALVDAIEAGGDAGMLFVAAAGNSGVNADASPMYPAAYDSDYIISVAATDQFDQYAYFSNWGATSVDLAAPGVDILSTWPGGGYEYLSGTSMATPHVAGAAALVWSVYPDASPLEVKQRLLSGAEYIGGIGGNAFMPTLTNGRLSLVNALENDSTPPSPVSGLAAVESTINSVALTWIATGDDGLDGTASAYDVRYSTSPITELNWESATRAAGEPLPQAAGFTESFNVTGLSPNGTYFFALRALDNVGNASALSDVVSANTLPVIVAFADDMEGDVSDWSANGLWHTAPWRWTSPASSFYYGDDFSLTYDVGWSSGTLTSPLIDLSSAQSAMLSFNEFRQVENFAPYDRAAVNVSTDGIYFTPIWESYDSSAGWENRTVDLTPWVGNSVFVQFQFDTGDDLYNYFEGWYVDDVQVWVPGSQEPGVYINNVSVSEGNGGPVEATFTVSLIDLAGPLTVHWETGGGSATDGLDYVGGSGDLVFGLNETSKTFTVSVNGDLIDEANEDFFVNLSTTSDVAIIDGQGRATIVDDDTAGIALSAPDGLETSESGTERPFSVVLTSQPTADVTISLASSDTTEGTVTPATLTFTTGNWNSPQSATVKGVNDALDDGDVFYFVSATATSADSAYSGLSNSLSAKNLDNDHSVTFSSTAVPKSIPDGGSTTSTLLVTGNHTILDINARVSIAHAKAEDVDVHLSGAGVSLVELFTDVGGSGNNFTNTTLDDEAGTLITAGSAPFNGTYRPEGSLTAFDGKLSGGTWTLTVADDKKGQKGTLTQWSITIFYEDAAGGSTAALVRPSSGQASSGGRAQGAFAPLAAEHVDPVFAESAPAPASPAGRRLTKGEAQHDSRGSRANAAAGSPAASRLTTLEAGLGGGSAGGQASTAAAVDAALDSLLTGSVRRRRR